MHFAYPPRKNSNATAFTPRSARSARMPMLRRSRTRLFTAIGLFLFAVIFLLSRGHGRPNAWVAAHQKTAAEQRRGGGGPSVAAGQRQQQAGLSPLSTNYMPPGGKPPVVLVTVLDETNFQKPYLDLVRENRKKYAQRHGYATFFPKVGEYDVHGSPLSWTKVVAMRHALTLFPDCRYVWFLEQDAFIMDMDRTVESDLMAPAKLESLMIKDYPVVPPDSIIKTFAHLRGQDVDFLLTQDFDGLSTASFVIRNGAWAQFFFETWFDPLYRSYNFQKAETHALWHPTILSKMALVPQRTINAYDKNEHGSKYERGDVTVRVLSCSHMSSPICEADAKAFVDIWRAS